MSEITFLQPPGKHPLPVRHWSWRAVCSVFPRPPPGLLAGLPQSCPKAVLVEPPRQSGWPFRGPGCANQCLPGAVGTSSFVSGPSSCARMQRITCCQSSGYSGCILHICPSILLPPVPVYSTGLSLAACQHCWPQEKQHTALTVGELALGSGRTLMAGYQAPGMLSKAWGTPCLGSSCILGPSLSLPGSPCTLRM